MLVLHSFSFHVGEGPPAPEEKTNQGVHSSAFLLWGWHAKCPPFPLPLEALPFIG